MQNGSVTTGTIRRPRTTVAARAARHERRTRLRLRDLCDEVLASYRLARQGDLWSADERREAERLLASMVPSLGH